jgi:hypothetical protein
MSSMTSDEIKAVRDDMQAELRLSIAAARRNWLRTATLHYVIRTLTVVLAAIVACESLLQQYLRNPAFWDFSSVLVLLLLLVDLSFRPGEAQKAHNNYIGAAEIIARRVSLVDYSDPSVLSRLDDLNNQWEILKAKHRSET